MLKFPCLVLDHDDTVVQTEATINYPFFCEILRSYRPGTHITLKEYAEGCFHTGFAQMCREKFQFTEQELSDEYHAWTAYIRSHTPEIFPGIEKVIQRQKEEGGLICVVSHSNLEIILRDYEHHFGIVPNAVYGWDCPEHQRKPSTYPLEQIMQRFSLKKEDLLVVDDMKPGYEMASKAGVPIAFAAWARNDCPEILELMSSVCNFTFHSPKNLEAFLFD